jgi:hypothetical protein
MCKNAAAPCPGCTKHAAPDAAAMFLADWERQDMDAQTGRAAARASGRPQDDGTAWQPVRHAIQGKAQ